MMNSKPDPLKAAMGTVDAIEAAEARQPEDVRAKALMKADVIALEKYERDLAESQAVVEDLTTQIEAWQSQKEDMMRVAEAAKAAIAILKA